MRFWSFKLDRQLALATKPATWLQPRQRPVQRRGQEAWDTGRQLLQGLDTWPSPIGDWRSYRPPAGWSALPLPADWAE